MAKKFNLQPWRERLRNDLKKQFTNATAVISLLTVGLLFGDKYLNDRYIEQQNNAITKLDQEIKTLENTKKQIEAIKLVTAEVEHQIKVINQLQEQRGFTVELLDVIAKSTPRTVFLNSIEYNNRDNQITIGGVAENDSAVSEFIRNMANFKRLGDARLNKDGIFLARSTSVYRVDNPEVKEFIIVIPVLSGVLEKIK